MKIKIIYNPKAGKKKGLKKKKKKKNWNSESKTTRFRSYFKKSIY